MREMIKMAQDELMNAKNEMEQQKIVKIIILLPGDPTRSVNFFSG